MKYILLLLFSVFILLGCAKKATPTPEPIAVPKEGIIDVSSEPSVIEIPDVETTKTEVAEDNLFQAEGIFEELPKEIIEVKEPQTSIQIEYDFDELFPDSIWTEYMTKRGDYLSLIAHKEYNNPNEWRRIYQWNRQHWEEKGIGPDRENPNFIYPYRELDLKKPANNVIEWAFDYYIHEVETGETLWTIAKKVYEDELAWVVLFWDNENILNNQDGKLIPNMELKVRSKLWPDIE